MVYDEVTSYPLHSKTTGMASRDCPSSYTLRGQKDGFAAASPEQQFVHLQNTETKLYGTFATLALGHNAMPGKSCMSLAVRPGV